MVVSPRIRSRAALTHAPQLDSIWSNHDCCSMNSFSDGDSTAEVDRSDPPVTCSREGKSSGETVAIDVDAIRGGSPSLQVVKQLNGDFAAVETKPDSHSRAVHGPRATRPANISSRPPHAAPAIDFPRGNGHTICNTSQAGRSCPRKHPSNDLHNGTADEAQLATAHAAAEGSGGLERHPDEYPVAPNFCERNVALTSRDEQGPTVDHPVLNRREEASEYTNVAALPLEANTSTMLLEPPFSDGGETVSDRQLDNSDSDSMATASSIPDSYGVAQGLLLGAHEGDSMSDGNRKISFIEAGEPLEWEGGTVACESGASKTGRDKKRKGYRRHRRRKRETTKHGEANIVRHHNNAMGSTEDFDWMDRYWLLSPEERKRQMRYIALADRTGATVALEVLAAKIDCQRMRSRDLFNTVSVFSG